jgi:hypothetical protein
MQKLSGRVPGTIYGKDLSHIFIYDKFFCFMQPTKFDF